MNFLFRFLSFIFRRKKYWLFPIFIALVLIGMLIFVSQGTVVAPFIYTIF